MMRDRRPWRKVWMGSFVFILFVLFAGVLPSHGQILPEENVFLFRLIDSVGYLTKEAPQGIGQVVAPRAERAVLIGENEVIYCDVGTNQGVHVGDELIVFHVRTYRKLKGYRVVEIEARVRVTEVNEEECAAVIEEAFIDVSIGSRVDFYRPLDQRIPLKAAPVGLEGEVIWVAEGSIVVGEGELVYINRGSVDGVEPGQCYEIYRVPAAGPSPPVKYRSRDYHTQRPVSKKHLTTTVGEMMILRTQETTSSALVIESDLPLELGELFRAGCPRLEQLAKAEEPPPVAPIPPPPEEDWARRQFENKNINFAFDSYALDNRAREILEEKARFLKERSGLNILIEGHCDERGTEQYNLALGDRRAHASKQYLIGLGILEARMSTVSYGEERPLDPGHNEGAWAKNRRAHFIILNP